MLATRMRNLNPGRLITYASNQPLLDEHELDFCDFLSMNYYSGSLAEHVDQYPEQLTAVLEKKLGLAQKLYPNVPHVMTEFGYVSIRGIHGNLHEGRFAEDFELYDSGESREGEDLWRIFYKNAKNPPDQLPRSTTLERVYADLLMRGELPGWGSGVLLAERFKA